MFSWWLLLPNRFYFSQTTLACDSVQLGVLDAFHVNSIHFLHGKCTFRVRRTFVYSVGCVRTSFPSSLNSDEFAAQGRLFFWTTPSLAITRQWSGQRNTPNPAYFSEKPSKPNPLKFPLSFSNWFGASLTNKKCAVQLLSNLWRSIRRQLTSRIPCLF